MKNLINNVRFHALLTPPILVLVFFLAYFFYPEDSISNLFSLFCLGALGGTTSTYYRLKDLPTKTEPIDAQANRIAIFQVYVSPVVAGAFATIMYIALVSQIITGPLFPTFIPPEESAGSIKFIDFLWKSTPTDTINSAKLCLWAFIAGFAERLIPNMIDRIVNESNNGD